MLFQTTAAHIEEVLAESAEKTVLLDFYAPWCAPCRALAPLLDAFSDAREETLSAYCINIDTDAALAERFAVTAVPTVIVLRNGERTARLEGEITQELLEKEIL